MAVVVVVAATMALVIRPPIKEPGLAHRLIAMQRAIDKSGVQFSGARPTFGELSEALRNKVRDAEAVDAANTKKLATIIATHGWPTKQEVGREGESAALNVVSRARDVDFQARALDLMSKAGVTRNVQYARLVDLVAVARQQPQTYGTQWTCSEDGEGRVQPTTPIADPQHLDQLRQSVGLPPYDKFAEFCAGPPGSSNTETTYIIQRRNVP